MESQLICDVLSYSSLAHKIRNQLGVKQYYYYNLNAFRMIATKIKSRASSLTALPSTYVPTDQDVICAKGRDAKMHPGNKFLRACIISQLEEYRTSTSRAERSFVVSQIIKQVQQRGGLFVRKVKGGWADIGSANSREKVGATFRDFLHEHYRSSTKAKAVIRRHRRQECSFSTCSPDLHASSSKVDEDLEPLPVTHSHVHLDFDTCKNLFALPQTSNASFEDTMRDFLSLTAQAAPQFSF